MAQRDDAWPILCNRPREVLGERLGTQYLVAEILHVAEQEKDDALVVMGSQERGFLVEVVWIATLRNGSKAGLRVAWICVFFEFG